MLDATGLPRGSAVTCNIVALLRISAHDMSSKFSHKTNFTIKYHQNGKMCVSFLLNNVCSKLACFNPVNLFNQINIGLSLLHLTVVIGKSQSLCNRTFW